LVSTFKKELPMTVRGEKIVDTRWFENAELVRLAPLHDKNKQPSGLYRVPGLNKWAVGHGIGKKRGEPVLLEREGGIFDGMDVKTHQVASWLNKLRGRKFRALIAVREGEIRVMKPLRFEELDGKRGQDFENISIPGKNRKREKLTIDEYLNL
jgi:hypothetical protein